MVPISVLPERETGGRSAVYRVFGDDQRLLYIGSTERPRQRWHEHRSRTAWWPLAWVYSLTWLPTREAAYEAEAAAIRTERPIFNQDWQPRPIPVPRMTPDPVEEVRQVTDALDAVDRIEDPEERVRARNQVLADQLKRSQAWTQERRELVLSMRAEKITYREIGERLNLSISTVQGIVENYRGSGKTRKKAEPKSEGAGG